MNKLKAQLAKISQRPMTAVVYGPPGIGKTEFVAQFPDPLFICDGQEDGVEDLVAMGYIDLAQDGILYFDGFKEFCTHLEGAIDISCGSVIIETLAGWEMAMHKECFEGGDYRTWDAFTSFNRGFKACRKHVDTVVTLLQKIRHSGKRVIMTGHATPKNFRNPCGPDYDHLYPDCQAVNETWRPLSKWFANIWYMDLDIEIEEPDGPVGRAKASSGGRVMYVSPNAAYECKNRFRIVDPIDMGTSGKQCYYNLIQAIEEAKK